MVLSQISNKFHKFQQITKQGKEMYNVRQAGNKCCLQISNVLSINFAKSACAQIRFSSFNDMFKFINRGYLFCMGWYTVPQF